MTEIESMVEGWKGEVGAMLLSYPDQFVADRLLGLMKYVFDRSGKVYGSNDRMIESAEFRLGLKFPRDYREFLMRYGAMPAPALVPSNRFLHPDELGLYRLMYEQDFLLWNRLNGLEEQMEVYGAGQLPELFSREQLGSCVVISTHEGSGVYLLNPEVSGTDWMEAWWLDFSLPGAVRFRTFTDLLRSELARSAEEIASTLT